MGDLSKHFNRREFACKDHCGFDTVDTGTLAVLEAVREHWGRPVRITSGCRCRSHNFAIGGASGSKHMEGRAADFTIAGVSPPAIAGWIRDTFPDVSVKAYPRRGFVHVDTRTGAPWRP